MVTVLPSGWKICPRPGGVPCLVDPQGNPWRMTDPMPSAVVADALGIKRNTVRMHVWRGQLPGRRIGNTWFVPAYAVMDRAAHLIEAKMHADEVRAVEAARKALGRKRGRPRKNPQ